MLWFLMYCIFERTTLRKFVLRLLLGVCAAIITFSILRHTRYTSNRLKTNVNMILRSLYWIYWTDYNHGFYWVLTVLFVCVCFFFTSSLPIVTKGIEIYVQWMCLFSGALISVISLYLAFAILKVGLTLQSNPSKWHFLVELGRICSRS